MRTYIFCTKWWRDIKLSYNIYLLLRAYIFHFALESWNTLKRMCSLFYHDTYSKECIIYSAFACNSIYKREKKNVYLLLWYMMIQIVLDFYPMLRFKKIQVNTDIFSFQFVILYVCYETFLFRWYIFTIFSI